MVLHHHELQQVGAVWAKKIKKKSKEEVLGKKEKARSRCWGQLLAICSPAWALCGPSACGDTPHFQKNGPEMAQNGRFLCSAQECLWGEKGSKWLQPSKALNHRFLIGASVSKGINESGWKQSSGAHGLCALVNGPRHRGLGVIQEKLPRSPVSFT